MKKIILITLCMLVLILHTKAQSKSKQPTAPTQKEMDDAMKGMQKISDGMTPEQKQMLEKMGVKIPTGNDMPKMTQGQMQQAMDIANRVVPPKDDARIASIPKSLVTSSTLPGYLAETHNKVLEFLKPEVKSKGDEVYRYIKSKKNSALATGNFAVGLWMLGKIELALYVMGKACIDDPSNTDNRNNYAAMLSMTGAEHLAIPLLNNLNQRFHKNSTILNNLGQAWFGLGDMNKANAYLDSTIRLYPGHSQANQTKSAVEESKGNTAGAIAAMKKSMNEVYTEDKQEKLSQLGYEATENDIKLPNKPKPDPLGLEKFVTPAIPKSVEEAVVLHKEWEEFNNAIQAKLSQLEPLHAQAMVIANQATEKRQAALMSANKTGVKVAFFPYRHYIASKKLAAISTDADGT